MLTAYKTLRYAHGITANIYYDPEPTSPAEWDNLGEIAYCSDRYTLGTQEVTRERMHEIAAAIESGEYIGLPVYAYVHGGATIRCASAFSCPWDSGQSGFVYVSKAKVREEWKCKRISPKLRETVLSSLRGLVEEFDQFLTGDVYGVVVTNAEGDEIDACWGYYGSDYVEEEAEGMAQHAVAAAEKEVAEAQYWAERDVCTTN